MSNDFEKTLEAKSDQYNAADLMGREIEVTIKSIKVKRSDDQPVTITLDGHDKFYRPSKGMRRLMAHVWESTDPQVYIGKSLTLYRDPEVRWSGKEVGGIVISAASHIAKPVDVTIPISRTKTKTYTVKPMVSKNVESLNHARDLRAEMESVAGDDEAKRKWWAGLTADEREQVRAMSAGGE